MVRANPFDDWFFGFDCVINSCIVVDSNSLFAFDNCNDFEIHGSLVSMQLVVMSEDALRKSKHCPICRRIHLPVLERLDSSLAIQVEFPHESEWKREQHLSGVCSEKCYKELQIIEDKYFQELDNTQYAGQVDEEEKEEIEIIFPPKRSEQ